MRITPTVVLGACLALVGCTASTPLSPEGSSAQGSAPPASVSSSRTPTPDPSAAPTELPVLGTRHSSDGGSTLDISLREVRVGDQAMSLTWSAANTSPSGSTPWNVRHYFSDGVIVQKGALPLIGEAGGVADGAYVVDAKQGKRYLAARDAQGECVCSRGLTSVQIVPGQTGYFSALFRSVPADVQTVDVFVPGAGTFGGVRVTR